MIRRGVLGHEGKRHTLEDFSITVSKQNHQHGADIENEIQLASAAGGESVLADIITRKVFRKREDQGYRDFVPIY